jgi:hypothetical protein
MSDELIRGREAYAQKRWGTAYEAFATAAEAGPLDAPDQWRLALAAYLTGRDAFNHGTSKSKVISTRRSLPTVFKYIDEAISLVPSNTPPLV